MASAGNFRSMDGSRWLECQICLSSMVGRKPRGLNCLHTFCETCLLQLPSVESYIKCPTCRGQTKLPKGGVLGLPINFMIEQSENKFNQISLCQACVENDGTSSTAVFYCNDGCGRLCSSCKTRHDAITHLKKHNIEPLKSSGDRCSVHNKELHLFCTKCKTCLCSTCALSLAHQGHEEMIEETMTEYQRLGAKIKDEAKAFDFACKDKLSIIQAEEKMLKTITEDIEVEYKRRIQVLDEERIKLLETIEQLSKPLIEFRTTVENLRERSRLIVGNIQIEDLKTCPQEKMAEIILDEGRRKGLEKDAENVKKPQLEEHKFVVPVGNTELGKILLMPSKVISVGWKGTDRSKKVNPKCYLGGNSRNNVGIDPAINPQTGQPDYSLQWAEYYRQLGLHYHADATMVQVGGSPGQQPPSQGYQQQPAINPQTGQPDYSLQWAEYCRQLGLHYHADATMGQVGGSPGQQPPSQGYQQQPGGGYQGIQPPQQ